ncbi:MAG TPA: LysM peptidoglycan-binding domain-containing protein, partial [Anaerolineales bacterium]
MKTKSIQSVFLSALLALALFAAVLPQPVQAASDTPTAACAQTYTVKKGQNTVQIAKLFGMPWGIIAKANHLAITSVPATGDDLCIPYKKGAAPVTGKVVVTAKGDMVTITASKFSHGEV